MSGQGLEGYAYRLAAARRQDVLGLAGRLLLGPLWHFRGATQWDFSAKVGRGNLRPVEQIAALAPEDLAGDFGHLFTAECELRWRRTGDDGYDVLVLREEPLEPSLLDELGLHTVGVFLATAPPAEHKGGVLIEERHGRLGVVEYRDRGSRALRLIRYTGRTSA